MRRGLTLGQKVAIGLGVGLGVMLVAGDVVIYSIGGAIQKAEQGIKPAGAVPCCAGCAARFRCVHCKNYALHPPQRPIAGPAGELHHPACPALPGA